MSTQTFKQTHSGMKFWYKLDTRLLAYENYVKENIIENKAIYQQLKQTEGNEVKTIHQYVNEKLNQLFLNGQNFNPLTSNEKVILIGHVTQVQAGIKI